MRLLLLIIFFNFLFFSKAIAGLTFVRSTSVENVSGYNVKGLKFNNDGTKMYTTSHSQGARSDTIFEYTLTIPYNISTATNTTSLVAGQFSTSLGNTTGGTSNSKLHGPTQIVFNKDGTKMFLTDFLERVFEYSLSTPFDIDTATTDMAKKSFDLNAGTPFGFSSATRLHSLAFNNDGTKLYVADAGSNAGNKAVIHEFDLSSPFDLGQTSNSYSPNITAMRVGTNISEFSTTTSIHGILFNHNGTKLYVSNAKSGNSELIQFKLTTAFDTSSRVHEGTLDMTSHGIDNITQQAFSSDGDKLFVLDDTTKKVFEFDLTCNWSVIDGACDDPVNTNDAGKDILGSIESQTTTAKNIVIHTTTPVLNRMYWLRRHRTSDKLSHQDIKFNFSNSMMASLVKLIPASSKTNDALDKLSSQWSFWSEGSISVGSVGDTFFSSSKEINSNGVTIGMDKKISENKLYGYAFRYGNDKVDVGTSGTNLDTDAYSLSIYGTFPHDDKKFVEGIFGASKLYTYNERKTATNTYTGERGGVQAFGSINYLTTYSKDNFNITQNARIDLSLTELQTYEESGAASLVYNKQLIETGMVSTGFSISDIIDYDTFTFKPNGGLELGLDFSPSSDATYRYRNETKEYTKSIGQDTINLRGNIGFDLITENGFSLMTIYERNQFSGNTRLFGNKGSSKLSSSSGYSDTLYLGIGYTPFSSTKYAMALENDRVVLDYTKSINNLDLNMNTNYNLMSEMPEYDIFLELISTF